MGEKFAILIDGGFIKKKLQGRNRHFPTVAEIEEEVVRIKVHAALAAHHSTRLAIERPKNAEHEMHAIVLACKLARKQMLAGGAGKQADHALNPIYTNDDDQRETNLTPHK